MSASWNVIYKTFIGKILHRQRSFVFFMSMTPKPGENLLAGCLLLHDLKCSLDANYILNRNSHLLSNYYDSRRPVGASNMNIV